MRKFLPVLLMLLGTALAAQDPVYSQFYAAPLQLNPAFAGSAFAPRFGGIYRNQWPGLNAYQTYCFFYEQNIDRLNSGFGLFFEGDNAGDGILKTSKLSAAYAYNLRLSEGLLVKLGVEAGWQQTALNWDKLVFPDQLDPIAGPINTSIEQRPEQTTRSRLDISSGLLLLSDKVWLGLGLKHLNTPDQGFLLINNNVSRGLPLLYSVQGGMEFSVKKGNKGAPLAFISPNFLFISQGPYQQINLGAYAGLGPVFGGAWFRHTFGNSDAAILSLGFRQGVFKIGLSYDLTLSELAGRSGGAYELSFGVLLDQDETRKNKRSRSQINNCLGMFQ
jgi:type IX secretion system PorP/SprF family membrane protein